MRKEMEAKLIETQTSKINNRSVWHYSIDTPIGQFNVVEYEQPDFALKRFVYDDRFKQAEQKYKQICRGLVAGKL